MMAKNAARSSSTRTALVLMRVALLVLAVPGRNARVSEGQRTPQARIVPLPAASVPIAPTDASRTALANGAAARQQQQQQLFGARFGEHSLRWRAQELIETWESYRASRLRAVPFYMYDFPELPARTLIANYSSCAQAGDARTGAGAYKHAGDIFLLQQLERHPWRTRVPARARLLVVPVALGMDVPCGRLQASRALLKRVRRGALWRERMADHVLPGRSWRVRPEHVPGAPHTLWVGYITGRHIVQGAWRPQLIMPYADTGELAAAGIGARTGARAAAAGAEEEWAGEARRNVTSFFGGMTHRGPTKGTHANYRVRQLLRERRATLFEMLPGPDLPSTHVFVDSSRPELAAGHCGLQPCTPAALREATRHACRGSFDERALLRRTHFLLAPRGDTPATNRLERAFEFGPIPVLIADAAFHVAVPFQCMVPYAHLSAQLAEAPFACDPGRALAHVLRAWPRARRVRARALLRHFSRDLLWHHPDSRVGENVLIEAARLRDGPDALPCAFPDRLLRGGEGLETPTPAVRAWARAQYPPQPPPERCAPPVPPVHFDDDAAAAARGGRC